MRFHREIPASEGAGRVSREADSSLEMNRIVFLMERIEPVWSEVDGVRPDLVSWRTGPVTTACDFLSSAVKDDGTRAGDGDLACLPVRAGLGATAGARRGPSRDPRAIRRFAVPGRAVPATDPL